MRKFKYRMGVIPVLLTACVVFSSDAFNLCLGNLAYPASPEDSSDEGPPTPPARESSSAASSADDEDDEPPVILPDR